ncbi:hypothetical protein [Streptomyces fuscichromogenes]|uniref:Uncharacterized protein n=1 Tax=Streptomyces fuscichromogenes TaxID=1324013 RepID=A0A917UJ95_9ACTN|nr:hypothetical protein [Streptomyces fuscichromogenes]GGM93827.1 hypothetical protein GCM10011578_012570 [Streptomyces fuscichromogenes]
MSGEKQGGAAEPEFEARVRALLAGDAALVRPSSVPYPEIRRRGVLERRRRLAVGGAALAALAALPVGAYALGGGTTTNVPAGPGPTAPVSERPAPTGSATGPASASPTGPATGSPPAPSATPTAPARPASPADQLLDGITFDQAAADLGKCLEHNKAQRLSKDPAYTDLGRPADYRILLAMRSTGDSNAPGDGRFVVAVREKPVPARLICTVKDGTASGLNTSIGDPFGGVKTPVAPDINSGKLYQESVIDKGNWKLPFRWGIIGGYRASVATMTVSYGGGAGEVVLDHGWFVATGTLHKQVTAAPHLKGYDATGKLVYDSDQDTSYERTLP